MYTTNPVQNWVARLDRRLYALLVGLAVGVIGGLVGLLIAATDPIIAIGAVLGGLAGLYVITNVNAALYGVIVVLALLPFGTFPFSIGFRPTLLDGALGAFLLVYILQWATSARREFLRLTPVHGLIALYAGWLILSFVLGLRHASITATVARQFAETLIAIGMAFVLVDLLRSPTALRRLVLLVMVMATAQAVITLALYALPDVTTERTLIRLARIGYPDGGVIRYIEDNPLLDERAIGTFVDPNVLGGFLAICASMIAPQVFSRKPVLRSRWLALVALGLVAGALFLTYSRAAMLAFGVGLVFISLVKGYRAYLVLMILGASVVLILPETQDYVTRFADAFTAGDLATQMRIGEYTDSFRLISRYPITGVGFTGTPERDIYIDVASMYLIMANQIGLVGVGLFALTMLGVFSYGYRAWKYARNNDDLRSIHLGYHAALLTVLVNGTTDHYFFRLDFQASVTLFWLVVALSLASSKLALTVSPVKR